MSLTNQYKQKNLETFFTAVFSGLGNPEPLEFTFPPLLSLLLVLLLRLVLTDSDDLLSSSPSSAFCCNELSDYQKYFEYFSMKWRKTKTKVHVITTKERKMP